MIKNNIVRLSVNLNKVALLRNARDGDATPDLRVAALDAINAGCHGITLHPRRDERHAKISDIPVLAEIAKERNVEINIEGDLRSDLIDAVQKNNVSQFTIVPVRSGEKTTERGWNENDDEGLLLDTIRLLKGKLRISVFIEPDVDAVRYVSKLGVDAVEFHTKWYAKSFDTNQQRYELDKINRATSIARVLGLRVNLGHDLNLVNLPAVIREVKPDEVSIGHALISDVISYGLGHVVGEYNRVLQC